MNYSEILARMRTEMWACYGSHTDSQSDIDVVNNLAHFQIWFWLQCHEPSGEAKFNLDFLGRWRGPLQI